MSTFEKVVMIISRSHFTNLLHALFRCHVSSLEDQRSRAYLISFSQRLDSDIQFVLILCVLLSFSNYAHVSVTNCKHGRLPLSVFWGLKWNVAGLETH